MFKTVLGALESEILKIFKGVWCLADVLKKIKDAIWGRGWVSLICYFASDKTLESQYDIHRCAMIADHVTLLAVFLPKFRKVGCS